MKTHIKLLISLVMSVSAISCVAQQVTSRFVQPVQSVMSAELSVTNYLVKQGKNLKDYELTSVTYNHMKSRWVFYYDGKDLAVGNHFTVILEEKEPNSISIVPGL